MITMKIRNKTIIFTSILIALVIITINTSIVVTKKHDERLIYSMKSRIEYYAKRCFLEEKCAGTMTLNTLYENDYLEEQVNPVTKEVLDSNIIIEFKDGEVIINWDNYNI